ncbi:RNA-dependent RNA polymerase [Erysiphe necator associated ourmia-like virus 123]|nr:RNA-dependent RNA polymerase [Erysiphe necator associated ourmia-like virus 123]
MPAIKANKNPISRRCRAYRQRVDDYLSRSFNSWSYIFQVPTPHVDLYGLTCVEVTRKVKTFLSSQVSDDPAVQLSFQLIKKGLPDSCPCLEKDMIASLRSKITSSRPTLSPGYKQFVRQIVRAIFPKGWDSDYNQKCIICSPPLSSVFLPESKCSSSGSRGTGGCLGWMKYTQGEFIDATMHGLNVTADIRAELILVQSPGKPRALTKFTPSSLLLKPLHKTIYGRLKRQRWLLVGPPTTERLRRAGFEYGKGDLVSGDYASATDGLSIEVAEVIIDTLLSTSVQIPEEIKEYARAILRPELTYRDSDGCLNPFFRPTRGQMMGSYLSFPLLCLQNYAAFMYSVREIKEKIPVLINGDDILFQRSNHFETWLRCLKPIGLTVEESKTDVSNFFGTINSTLLRWEGNYLRPQWVLKTAMFRTFEDKKHLGDKFMSFLKDCPVDYRYRAGREFFDWNIGNLRRLGVSPVSLGFRGLLARRLSKKFGLLELPEVEIPDYFKTHGVCYPPEFIMEVDPESLSQEEFFLSSLEFGSEKWNRGWIPADILRNCYSYVRSLASIHEREIEDYFHWQSISDQQFSFELRNRISERRRCKSKAFTMPQRVRTTRIFNYKVFEELFHGGLPTYDSEKAAVLHKE